MPAAIEYLDAGAIATSAGAFPEALPEGARFLVITEADGAVSEVAAAVADLKAALEQGTVMLWAPTDVRKIRALWRWRDGVSLAVSAQRRQGQ